LRLRVVQTLDEPVDAVSLASLPARKSHRDDVMHAPEREHAWFGLVWQLRRCVPRKLAGCFSPCGFDLR